MMAGKVRVSGPLAPYAAGFAEWLAGQGYAPSTVGHQLRLVARLSRWLAEEGVPPAALSEAVALRFAQSVRVTGRARPAARAVEPVLGYLRGLGAVPLPEPPCQESPRRRLLSAYERYLTGDRSLSPATVIKYMHIATVFLAGLPDPSGEALAGWPGDPVRVRSGSPGQEHGGRTAGAAALPISQRACGQAACRGGPADRGV